MTTPSVLRVLVVGGAGYVGSVCARTFQRAGADVVVLDDLSSGHREAVACELVRADVRDRERVRSVLAEGRFHAVLHFAALSLVGDSVKEPVRYFDVNVGGTLSLLRAMQDTGTDTLVFSSTCAVYGDPVRLPLDESHPMNPVSPYGWSKAMVEHILAEARRASGLRVASLRYFNAAGAWPEERLGESHHPETHLIPIALDAALGRRGPLQVFGLDYDTRDGSSVRDYVHVRDLADAHVAAVEKLRSGHPGGAWNLGTGTGTTVLEVLEAVREASGREVPWEAAPRRAGDPPALCAQADLARADLGWTPQRPGIVGMVRDAWQWAREPAYGARP